MGPHYKFRVKVARKIPIPAIHIKCFYAYRTVGIMAGHLAVQLTSLEVYALPFIS